MNWACATRGKHAMDLIMCGCCGADWIWQLTSTTASAGSGERSAPMLMRLLLWTGSRPALCAPKLCSCTFSWVFAKAETAPACAARLWYHLRWSSAPRLPQQRKMLPGLMFLTLMHRTAFWCNATTIAQIEA